MLFARDSGVRFTPRPRKKNEEGEKMKGGTLRSPKYFVRSARARMASYSRAPPPPPPPPARF